MVDWRGLDATRGCILAAAFVVAGAARGSPLWTQEWQFGGDDHAVASWGGRAGNRFTLVVHASADSTASVMSVQPGDLQTTRRLLSSNITGLAAGAEARDGAGYFVLGYRTGEATGTAAFIARLRADGSTAWFSDALRFPALADPAITETSDGNLVLIARPANGANADLLLLDGDDGRMLRLTSGRAATDSIVRAAAGPDGSVYLVVSGASGLAIERFDTASWTSSWRRDLAGGSLDTFTPTALRVSNDGAPILVGRIDAGDSDPAHRYRLGAYRFAADDGSVTGALVEPTGYSEAPDSCDGFGVGPDLVLFAKHAASTRALRGSLDSGIAAWVTPLGEPYGPSATDASARLLLAGAEVLPGLDGIYVKNVDLGTGVVTWRASIADVDDELEALALTAPIGGRVLVGAGSSLVERLRAFVVEADGSVLPAPAPALSGRVAGDLAADGADHTLVVGAALQASGPVLTIQRIRNVDGMPTWSVSQPFGDALTSSIERPGIRLGPNGSAFAWANATFTPGDWQFARGATLLASIDAGSGTVRWTEGETTSVWQTGYRPHVHNVVPAPQGRMLEYSWRESRTQQGGTSFAIQLQQRRATTPVVDWSLARTAVTGLLPVSDGLVDAGLGTVAGAPGIVLRRYADGGVEWERPLAIAAGSPLLAELQDSSVVVAFASSSGGTRDVGLERLRVADGSSVWTQSIGTNDGVNQTLTSMTVADNDDVAVAWRSGASSSGSLWLARRAAANGVELWSRSLLPAPRSGGLLVDLRVAPDGRILGSAESATTGDDGSPACLPCRHHVVSFDGQEGTLLGWNLLGSGIERDGAGGSFSTEFGGFSALPGLIHARSAQTAVASDTLVLEHVALPGSAHGDLTTSLSLSVVDSGALLEVPFQAQVAYQGTVPADVLVRIAVPLGASLSNLSCHVVGSGACGTGGVISQGQQRVLLEPAALAIVQGTMVFSSWLTGNPTITVAAELPFEVGTLSPHDDTAQQAVPLRLLSDSFE